MKVSILVTTYNIEKYVGDAIESVVSQDMPFDWELLVGDDGSKDGTTDIIKKWVSRYPNNIKLFVHERGDNDNKVGSRAAKNRAFLLEKAKGEYIQFLDGDDVFLNKNKIKTQVNILDDPANITCACCGHNMEVFNIPTGERHLMTKETPGDAIYGIKEYWLKHYYSTDTILFRRKCLELLLDPLYRDYLNDNFITYLIMQFGDIYYLDKIWAQYNQTGDGLWTGHTSIYGDFRNMHLFDLERKVRNDMDDIIMSRHCISIRRIRREYKHGMEEGIKSLVDGLDPKVFHYTLLLSKLDGLTIGKRIRKAIIFTKADFSYLKARVRAHVKNYTIKDIISKFHK